MTKRKRWFANSVWIVIFFLTGCLSNLGKPDSLKEFEQVAKKELEKQYKESFVIKPAKKECIALTSQEKQDCNRELFTAEASPKSNPHIIFTINYYRSHGGFFDNNYLEQYIAYDLNQYAQSHLKMKKLILQVDVSFHSTENNVASYTGSVRDYQKKLKKIPSDTSIFVHLPDGNQSVAQKAEQIYRFSQISQLRTLATSLTFRYYAKFPKTQRNLYKENPSSSLSFSRDDLRSVQSIKEKIQQNQGK